MASSPKWHPSAKSTKVMSILTLLENPEKYNKSTSSFTTGIVAVIIF